VREKAQPQGWAFLLADLRRCGCGWSGAQTPRRIKRCAIVERRRSLLGDLTLAI
jgi:hypothetical protein